MSNKMLDQQADSTHRATSLATRRTIACVICQALYAPTQAQTYLLDAPPLIFESAFISMCRFCFRCRRPACPECWDHVHGVCGQCTLESQLLFRTEVAPLPGVLLKLPEREQVAPAPFVPERRFVCVYPGRFQTEIERVVAELPTSPPRERRQSQKIAVVATKAQPRLSIPQGLDIDDIITQPDLTVTFEPPTKPIPPSQTLPAKNRPAKQARTTQSAKHTPSIGSIIEHISINLLLLVLICILLLIVAAEVSPGANMFLSSTLHIDIRAEITYLLQLINHLHF